MGCEYISISSAFQAHHEDDSKIHVQLSRPIQYAKSVRLVSFSTSNEFFNIEAGNNIMMSFVYYHKTVTPPPVKCPVVIPPGFYESWRLIELINESLVLRDGDQSSGPGFDGTSATINQRSDLETESTMITPASSRRRVVLYLPSDSKQRTSLTVRLGFSNQYVITKRVGLFPGETPVLQPPQYRWLVLDTDESMNFLIWKPSNAGGQIRISNNTAFETQSHFCGIRPGFRLPVLKHQWRIKEHYKGSHIVKNRYKCYPIFVDRLWEWFKRKHDALFGRKRHYQLYTTVEWSKLPRVPDQSFRIQFVYWLFETHD